MTCTHCAWQVVCRASPIASNELDLGASVTVDASSSSCLDPNKVCISLRTYSAVAADLENSSRTIGGRPCLAAYYSPLTCRTVQALPQRVFNAWTGGWDVQTVNGTQATFWDVQPGFNLVDCQLQTSSCRLYRTARYNRTLLEWRAGSGL